MDRTLKLCIHTMTFALVNPEEPRNIKWLMKFIVMYGIFSTTGLILVCNIYYEIINNNLIKACENGNLALSFTGVTTNCLVLFWHQDTLKKIISIMRRDINEFKELPEEDQIIAKEYFTKQKFVWKLFLVLCLTCVTIFLLQSICSMVYYYFIGDFKLIPFFDLHYLNFIEDRKDNFIVYLMTYGLLTHFFVVAGISFLTITSLGPVSMLHACLRLELIKKRLEKLYSGEVNGVNERLNRIAKDLQETYSFVELIERCFSLYYELILKLSTFTIPVTLYELLELLRRREVNLQFTSFVVTGTTISAYPCFYSDMLMEKGEDVRLAAYSCGWEAHYKRRVRSSLLLILTRTTRPVAIRTMFRTVSLIALSEMFQQAYTIFNLMNAALN